MQSEKEFKELFFKVKKIVDKIDPVKIGYLSEDEYDNESFAITNKIYQKNLSQKELENIVKDVFVFFFSEDYITDEDCKKMGEEIYKILTF